jgi:hypothetical protein
MPEIERPGAMPHLTALTCKPFDSFCFAGEEVLL